MRALSYSENPIQQAYGGGDQINVRQLQNFCNTTANNFRELETSVVSLEQAYNILHHKLKAAYEFIEWIEQHSPETLQAYKAFNTVTHAFDRAQQHGEAMAETGGS